MAAALVSRPTLIYLEKLTYMLISPRLYPCESKRKYNSAARQTIPPLNFYLISIMHTATHDSWLKKKKHSHVCIRVQPRKHKYRCISTCRIDLYRRTKRPRARVRREGQYTRHVAGALIRERKKSARVRGGWTNTRRRRYSTHVVVRPFLLHQGQGDAARVNLWALRHR